MGLMFFWILSIIASFIMEIIQEMRIFKDVADEGYKINLEKMSEWKKQFDPNSSKILYLSLLIPIYNFMVVFKRTIDYNNARSLIIDQLGVLGFLEKMSEREKKEYLKKPTALNAMIVTIILDSEKTFDISDEEVEKILQSLVDLNQVLENAKLEKMEKANEKLKKIEKEKTEEKLDDDDLGNAILMKFYDEEKCCQEKEEYDVSLMAKPRQYYIDEEEKEKLKRKYSNPQVCYTFADDDFIERQRYLYAKYADELETEEELIRKRTR